MLPKTVGLASVVLTTPPGPPFAIVRAPSTFSVLRPSEKEIAFYDMGDADRVDLGAYLVDLVTRQLLGRWQGTAAKLGKSQDTSAANSRRPEPESGPDRSGVPFSSAGAASGSP
jgi:hypothetical protein